MTLDKVQQPSGCSLFFFNLASGTKGSFSQSSQILMIIVLKLEANEYYVFNKGICNWTSFAQRCQQNVCACGEIIFSFNIKIQAINFVTVCFTSQKDVVNITNRNRITRAVQIISSTDSVQVCWCCCMPQSKSDKMYLQFSVKIKVLKPRTNRDSRTYIKKNDDLLPYLMSTTDSANPYKFCS